MAGPWTFYNAAKRHLADGSIDLDSDDFYMSLHSSAANVTDLTLSTYDQATGEVVAGNGYVAGGQLMDGITWQQGASAKETRFNCDPVTWSASGGDITRVKYAVIHKAGATSPESKLLCVAQLSGAAFDVTSGNTITITPSANGIFELN